MVVEQIIDIPANRRITLEVPKTVPQGRTILTFTPMSANTVNNSHRTSAEESKMGEVRRLLQKEMAEKGTEAVTVESGDGWEAHVRERYAES